MDKKLTGEFDARVWAKEFIRIFSINPNIASDEGTMIGWFANAIMAGYDKANQGNEAKVRELEAVQARLVDMVINNDGPQDWKLNYSTTTESVINQARRECGLER